MPYKRKRTEQHGHSPATQDRGNKRRQRIPLSVQLPASIWCEHVLPFVADRQTWNALASTSKEIRALATFVQHTLMREGRLNHFSWPIGTLSSTDRISWTCIQFLGKMLVAGSACGRLALWHKIKGSLGYLTWDNVAAIHAMSTCSSSTDGGLVAACVTTKEGDRAMAWWNIEFVNASGELLQTHGPLLFTLNEAVCLSFSQGGRFLAVGCTDRSVSVWDVMGRELILSLSHQTFESQISQVHIEEVQRGDQAVLEIQAAMGRQGIYFWTVEDGILVQSGYEDLPFKPSAQTFFHAPTRVPESRIIYGTHRGILCAAPWQFSCGKVPVRKVSFCTWDKDDNDNVEGPLLIACSSFLGVWKLPTPNGRRTKFFAFRRLQEQVVDFCLKGTILVSVAADGSIRSWELRALAGFEKLYVSIKNNCKAR